MLKLLILSIMVVLVSASCLEVVYQKDSKAIDTHKLHKIQMECKQAHRKPCECQKETQKYLDSLDNNKSVSKGN